ncbi:DHA2 family efflux MFS transporter permease subunit [Leucobacter sp. M11]|uniref:DHA2 family efflux MFS transporter permease subunit n=1 Tax=Leucobacter sp. M11 TaxID=2993565 RepID=UPI002D7F75A7|nr:DHA2 family efflux MFS transporter permease subunit [Leucobacter sp. M11]MEB4615386.1 DHA2 family efflux MFS transporter permease subunit [Leucobacter sp. M11]
MPEIPQSRTAPAPATPAPDTPATPAVAPPGGFAPLTGRAKRLALAGLMLSIFVSMLASTVVGTSMPRIIAELGGTQAAFTWVITGTMLASAVTTPIWGKLADLVNKKFLLQLSLVIFTLGSAFAGMAQDPTWLIVCRIVQGLGAGGLAALGQIVMADIISPRERGKYMGLMSAVMAVATVGGPLLGGVITDSIGWRWNFYVAVPVAVVAIVMLQRTLHLHTVKRPVKIDYLGAALISAGVSSLLIWVTLGGHQIEWWSVQSLIMVGGGLIALVTAVFVEIRAEEPLIPMTLFKNRTFTLSVVASLSVGVAMFGTSVFLGQYMQLARGKTPTESGLLTIPMVAGVLIASTLVGQRISKTGTWKHWMILGGVLLTGGLLLMGTLRYDTSFVLVSVYMALVGAGVGMTMQNLVLITQNAVAPQQVGVASSSVTFFRSIGGTAGMSAMGAMLGTQVAGYITEGIGALSPKDRLGAEALSGGTIPELHKLTEPIRDVVENAYGHAIGNVFLAAVPLAVVALIAIIWLPNARLGDKTTSQLLAEQEAKRAASLPGTGIAD